MEKNKDWESKIESLVSGTVEELSNKSLKDVQIDTALKWAARCAVAYTLGKTSDAEEYYHEAVEHAALVGDIDFIKYIFSFLRNTVE